MGNKDLLSYMNGRESAGRDEIIKLFGDTYKLPSYEKLANCYIAAKISQALRAARDEEGRRLILAKRGKGEIQYINIPACTDRGSLEHIKRRITRDIIGQRASLEKVDLRLETVQRDRRRPRRKKDSV
ncbi:MAG: hypothetical protein FWC80_00410 [Firmicutes bacterium]|nr:hypothetical protein [Bacillota bacterium]